VYKGITKTIAGNIYIIKIEVDKTFLPKNFNLATAYAAGIANKSVTITVPIDTAVLIKIYLPKL